MNAEQMPDMQQRIEQFLDGSPHAVVGASRNPSKIGYLVLQSYLQNDRMVYPVNPNADKIDGLVTYPDLPSMPEVPYGISIITPPHISETIVEQAGAIGVKNIWLQPGAESELAISRAAELGMNVIAGGPCILVVLGYRANR